MLVMIHPKTILFISIIACSCAFSQSNFYKNNAFDWNQFPQIKNLAKSTFSETTVIDDHTDIVFHLEKSEIRRLQTYYVSDNRSALELSTYALPDDFDSAFSNFMQTQGRKDLNKGAELDDFVLKQFGARALTKDGWVNLKVDYKFKKRRWLQSNGEIKYDQVPVLSIEGVGPGTVLQIYYSAVFQGSYGNNIFYLYGNYPKLNTEYYFEYSVDSRLNEFKFSKVFMISDSLVTHREEKQNGFTRHMLKVRVANLKANLYSKNCREAETLPHVVFSFELYNMIKNKFHDNGAIINDYVYVRARDFEWINMQDTNYNYEKVYVKHFTDLRKFMKTLPVFKRDSGIVGFLKTFRDTIAQFRFISENQIFMNEENLLDVGLLDHIGRRRITEESFVLLNEMLWEGKRFYYAATVMDKRFGNHSAVIRAHRPYEGFFPIIPEKDRYHFLLPRPNGVNLYPNELPYYFEGGVAALAPRNFANTDSNRLGKNFKFIRLQEGTANENTRTENASFSVNFEKKEISYKGKVNLSGQFSTILRHLYLKQAIDSTIEPYYFKIATDKPGAKNQQIKLSAKTTDYPFRHSFICSETLPLSNNISISLKDWFSFPLSKKVIPLSPRLDYYFDFTYTDIYNFVLIFEKPAEITNADAFTKKMTNEYFDLQSAIQKQENGNYLLSVRFQVKQPCLKVKDVSLLEEQLTALEELNNFSCQIKALE